MVEDAQKKLSPLLKLEQVSLWAKLKAPSPKNMMGYPILQNISWEIFPGDRIIIAGKSGSGKTSLLRLLNRLEDPSSGKIYLNNQEYPKIPMVELRRQIVLVAQEPKMLAMTVRESLAYPLLLRNISQGETEERIGYWRERLKIPQPWMGMTESELSLGQQQLVTLVRALVTLPKILLLDQPLSALDPVETSWLLERITEGISDLCPDVKTAVLMVTYQIDTFQEFSNRLLHLEQGQIVTNLVSSQVDWNAVKSTLITPAEEEW